MEGLRCQASLAMQLDPASCRSVALSVVSYPSANSLEKAESPWATHSHSFFWETMNSCFPDLPNESQSISAPLHVGSENVEYALQHPQSDKAEKTPQ